MKLTQLLKEVVIRQASDLHLKVQTIPIVRVGSELVDLDYPPITPAQMDSFVKEILDPVRLERFQREREIDLAYVVPDIGRFRVDIFYQRGMPGMVMRRVKKEFSNFAVLGLPEVLAKICDINRGIVLICGPARSGKSTTIATMINYINNMRRLHIITVEDPIEFLFEDNQSIVNQREIGIDTQSFVTALRHIMREDPDLIFIGEMRDQDSFQAAINAAETGHLVFTTLHAHSATQAIDRSLEYFPAAEREQVRRQLANNLQAVVAQKLLPKKDGSGLVPVVEVLIANGTVRKLIRENKGNKISAAIELGKEQGMQNFNRSLLSLVQSGTIAEEEAMAVSPHPETLRLNLQGIFLDDAKKILES